MNADEPNPAYGRRQRQLTQSHEATKNRCTLIGPDLRVFMPLCET